MKVSEAVVLAVAALLGVSEANTNVMQIVRESMFRLAEQGFFADALEHESVLNSPQECKGGRVIIEDEVFDCENVDFLSFLAMRDLEILEPAHHDVLGPSGADIWGWLSPTNREFTIMALDNGVAAIDSTDPLNPCIVAKMPTRRTVDKWADVKVYKNAMYHVKDTSTRDNAQDGSLTYGIEVYDLEPLDQIDCHVDGYVPLNLFPHFVFTGHGRSHNVVINPESGLLYSVGSEKCNGGLVILDVKTNPLEPVQVGCADEDGYTHDAQCLTYDGPDQKYQNKEICFAFNEDTLTVWDISIPSQPKVVSRTFYPNQVYSHQGWVNDDLTLVLLDDELDEMCNEDVNAHSLCSKFDTTELNGLTKTSTNVFNIEDLENPTFEGAYIHPDVSVDHNLYVWGTVHRKGWGGNPPMKNHPDPNYAYMNNYLAGVKIVDIHSPDFRDWKPAGHFDVAPDKTEIEFAGAWSGYLHPSGVYAVSSIERGLFLLKPNMAYTADFPQVDAGGDDGEGDDGEGDGDGEGSGDPDDSSSNGGLVAIVVVLLIGLTAMAGYVVYREKQKLGDAAKVPEQESLQEKTKSRPAGSVVTKNPMAAEETDV